MDEVEGEGALENIAFRSKHGCPGADPHEGKSVVSVDEDQLGTTGFVCSSSGPPCVNDFVCAGALVVIIFIKLSSPG